MIKIKLISTFDFTTDLAIGAHKNQTVVVVR